MIIRGKYNSNGFSLQKYVKKNRLSSVFICFFHDSSSDTLEGGGMY